MFKFFKMFAHFLLVRDKTAWDTDSVFCQDPRMKNVLIASPSLIEQKRELQFFLVMVIFRVLSVEANTVSGLKLF